MESADLSEQGSFMTLFHSSFTIGRAKGGDKLM